MILTSQQTIKAVREILADQVLPNLTTADWTASNVRACLLLLTYAEDCAELERGLFAATHSAMRDFFDHVLQRDDQVWLDTGLRAEVMATVAVLALDMASPDAAVSTLADHDMQAKSVLSAIIKRAGNARTAPAHADNPVFRTHLRTCLRTLQDADATLTARARTMLPL